MHFLHFMGHPYTKKVFTIYCDSLFSIYLRLQFNWTSCILFAKSDHVSPEKISYYKH